MTGWLKTRKFEEKLLSARDAAVPAGIGIDLISFSRAKVFLRKHRQRILSRLLTSRESRRYRGGRLSVLDFCRLFAAKEAYFKACGGVWMGLEGFSSIDVECLDGDRFRAYSSSVKPKAGGGGEGCFFRYRDLIGAEVVTWASHSGRHKK